VQRHLYKYDLHRRVIRRKPFLCPHHKIQCQKFAKEHLNEPDAFWKQVLWTDEVKIELYGCNEQWYFRRKTGAELHEKNTCPTVKHRGGSIMLWACVAASGTGNISQVEGKWIELNSSKFWKQTPQHL